MSRPWSWLDVGRADERRAAAAYCGEPSANAFLKRVGSEYPQPRVNEGGDGFGFGTISIRRSCRPTCSGSGTSPRICTVSRPLAPLRSYQVLANGLSAFYWDLTGYYRRSRAVRFQASHWAPTTSRLWRRWQRRPGGSTQCPIR